MNTKIYVIGRRETYFKDREEAGRLLGIELERLDVKNGVVLGILRGGVIVAREISGILDIELDIVLSRKLGAPANPELAIGAITETGKSFLDAAVALGVGADSRYVEKERTRQADEIRRRSHIYRVVRPKINLKGRQVIIADDGLATGATMQAALWSVRQEDPEKIIVAAPVASEEAVKKISENTDEAIFLYVPPFFMSVGQFYREFPQVADDKVLEILRENQERQRVK
ncbi:MAG: phosphoribosyltransferase [Deltaproteobacteria bacterium]